MNKTLLLMGLTVLIGISSVYNASLYAMQQQNKLHDVATQALDLAIDQVIPTNIEDLGDEFKFLYILELKYHVAALITAQTGFSKTHSATSLLMHWLASLLIITPNEDETLKQWRSLRTAKSIKNSFSEIKAILDLPEEKIKSLHAAVQLYLANAPMQIIHELIKRIHEKYGHRWNDEYEIKQESHPTRTLKAVQEQGIKVAFSAEQITELKKIAQTSSGHSLYEKIKNEKIFTINGLKDSKGSLVPHDIFDHVWMYDLLHKNGILKKYEDFLQSVGSPQNTDVFNRESELIAAIAYDFRFMYLSLDSFNALFTYQQIQDVLQHPKSENQRKAKELLTRWATQKDIIEKLPRIISGICMERMEQRRKYGFIKILDKQFKPVDILGPLDPEYVSLIVETVGCLREKKTEAFDALLNSILIFESHLQRMVHANIKPTSFVITLQDIKNFDRSKSSLSSESMQWIKHNLATISNRSTAMHTSIEA